MISWCFRPPYPDHMAPCLAWLVGCRLVVVVMVVDLFPPSQTLPVRKGFRLPSSTLKSKKVKSDFHVFTVKVNENGGFWPPEDAFWGPLGAPLALPKC